MDQVSPPGVQPSYIACSRPLGKYSFIVLSRKHGRLKQHLGPLRFNSSPCSSKSPGIAGLAMWIDVKIPKVSTECLRQQLLVMALDSQTFHRRDVIFLDYSCRVVGLPRKPVHHQGLNGSRRGVEIRGKKVKKSLQREQREDTKNVMLAADTSSLTWYKVFRGARIAWSFTYRNLAAGLAGLNRGNQFH